MEVRYKNNFWDIVKFGILWILTPPVGWLYVIGIGGLLSFVVLSIVRDLDEPLLTKIIVFSVLISFIGMIFLLFYVFLLLLVWITRKDSRESGLLRAHGSAISFESPKITKEIKWNEVKKIERFLGLTIIWVSGREAILIPDRAFSENAKVVPQFFNYVQNAWEVNRDS